MPHPQPLSQLKSGQRWIIVSIEAGENMLQRLHSLGLYVGAKLELLKNDYSGPVIVKCLDSKLALGRKQADRIFVKSIFSDD